MEGLFGQAMTMIGPAMQSYMAQNQDHEDQPHYQAAAEHIQNAQFDPSKHHPPTEEEMQHAAHAHQRIYENNQDVNQEEPDAIGGAVVAHVLQQAGGSGGGMPDMASLLPMMMSEASTLLGNAGSPPSLKTQVMQKIGMMALKSQLGGGGGGMLSVLQKFM